MRRRRPIGRLNIRVRRRLVILLLPLHSFVLRCGQGFGGNVLDLLIGKNLLLRLRCDDFILLYLDMLTQFDLIW